MTVDVNRNMFDLSGKTALVTGGGYGLGRTLVHGLAGHGARVVSVARSEDALAETFSTLGPEHRYIVGDLTDDAVYEELDAMPEDIDILVNNHGGDPFIKPWPEQSPDDWRGTYEINVVASMRLIHLLSPKMAERGFGRIINVSSVYGIIGQDRAEHDRLGWSGRLHGGQARGERPHALSRVSVGRRRSHRELTGAGNDHMASEPD